MASIIRFVEDDYSTVRLDLKSLLTTPTSGFDVISDVHLGNVDTDLELMVQEPVAGGEVAWSRHPDKEISFRLYGRWTDVDDGLELFGALHSELSVENILEVREDGATVSRFYSTYPSPLPSHVRGNDGAMVQFIRQLQDPFGVPVSLRTHPYSRRLASAGTPTARTNQILSRHLSVTNAGNAPGLSKITLTPETGARFGGVRIGVRSTGNLTEFATLYGSELESGSLGVDTTSQGSVTGASSSTVARVSFATNETMERRVRLETTPVDGTALEGQMMNVVRLKPSAADKFEIQLRWGLSDVDPVPFVNEVIPLDFSDVETFDWTPVDLGEISVGSGSGFLVREIHVRRVSGAGSLDLDMAHLFGAEQTSIYSVPGFRMGEASKERWRGDELTQGPTITDTPAESAGDIRENHARLNAEHEVMSIGPSTGKSWPAGVHRAAVDCTVYIDDASKSSSTKVGELQVIANDAGAGAWQVRKKIGLWSRKNRGKVERNQGFTFTISDADVAASTEFLIRVKHTEATASGRKILIHRIKHSFIRSVADTQKMVIDGTTNPPRMYVAGSDDSYIFPLNPEGTPFPTVPPGNSTWCFEFWDIPTDPGYDDIDKRGTLPRVVLTRSVTCQVDVVRRDTT